MKDKLGKKKFYLMPRFFWRRNGPFWVGTQGPSFTSWYRVGFSWLGYHRGETY